MLTTFECVSAEEIKGAEGTIHRATHCVGACYHSSVVVYYVVKLVNSNKQIIHRGRRYHTKKVEGFDDISTLSVCWTFASPSCLKSV